MPRATFGLFFEGSDTLPGPAAVAATVEELGLDGFWCGEAPSNTGNGGLPDSFATLCFAAAATSRITIGSNVVLLPLHHPVWVAKQWATLDQLCGGRTVLTVGAGGEVAKQFEAFGVRVSQRAGRTNEGIEVIRALWSQKEADYAGRYYRFTGISMGPKPVKPDGIPIWVGGRPGGTETGPDGKPRFKSRTAAIRRAATYGDGWCPYYMTVEGFRDSVAQVRTFATETGRDLSGMAWGYNTNLWLRDSYDTALADAQALLRYGRDLAGRIASYDLVGTPDDVIKRVEEYVAAGAQHFILHVKSRPGSLRHDLELLAREVAPAFR